MDIGGDSIKVIFLDIDGVHNTRESMYMDRIFPTPKLEGVEDRIPDHLSCYTVRLLNDIIKETGAKVVISSTWRLGFSPQEMQIILEYYGFKGEVIANTPNLWEGKRGDEIRLWINESDDVESFVIIDDDSDMCELIGHLVKTDGNYGIQYKDMKKAIEILNSPNRIKIFARSVKLTTFRKLRHIRHKVMWKLFKKSVL